MMKELEDIFGMEGREMAGYYNEFFIDLSI